LLLDIILKDLDGKEMEAEAGLISTDLEVSFEQKLLDAVF